MRPRWPAPASRIVAALAGGGAVLWLGLRCLYLRVAALADRARVAAVIVRSGRVLMVRQRALGPTGRHDGLEYWVLPGGGVEPGESAEQALAREVREEVGLTCLGASYLYDAVYPSGRTACYAVEVPPDEEPRLGTDDLPCGCPRMVGLAWVPVPPLASDGDGTPIPVMIQVARPAIGAAPAPGGPDGPSRPARG